MQVGYGDIHCTTTLGRAVIVLFILVGLVSDETIDLNQILLYD